MGVVLLIGRIGMGLGGCCGKLLGMVVMKGGV